MNSIVEEVRAGAAEASLPTHEKAYRRLRALILFGEMPPGAPVTIQGLTEQLDIGMTPAREAIRRLTAEGALHFQGNRRVIVPRLDKNAVGELVHARLAIEPELTRRACELINKAEVLRLREIDHQLDQAISDGDVRGYLEQNYRFHSLLYTYAAAPILQELAEGLWLRFGPSLRVICGRFGTQSLPDKHKAMLAALELGDAEDAAIAMAEDVRQGMVQIGQAMT